MNSYTGGEKLVPVYKIKNIYDSEDVLKQIEKYV
jgi:hypothetical protein